MKKRKSGMTARRRSTKYPPASQQGGGENDDDDNDGGGGGDAIPVWLIVVLVIPGVVLFALVTFGVLNQLYIFGWIGPAYETKSYPQFDERTPVPPNAEDQSTQSTRSSAFRVENGNAGKFSLGGGVGENTTKADIDQHSREDQVMEQLRRRFGTHSDADSVFPLPSKLFAKDNQLHSQSNVYDTKDVRPLTSSDINWYNRDDALKIIENMIAGTTSISHGVLRKMVHEMLFEDVFYGDSDEFESVWNEAMAAAGRR